LKTERKKLFSKKDKKERRRYLHLLAKVNNDFINILGFKKMAKSLENGEINLSDSIVGNVVTSSFIQFVWGRMEDLQFLTINTMISMNVPGIV